MQIFRGIRAIARFHAPIDERFLILGRDLYLSPANRCNVNVFVEIERMYYVAIDSIRTG